MGITQAESRCMVRMSSKYNETMLQGSPPENTHRHSKNCKGNLCHQPVAAWGACPSLATPILTVLCLLCTKPRSWLSHYSWQEAELQKARLVHLGTSLDFGTLDQVFDKLCLCYFLAGVGAQVLGFKVGMIEWRLQQGVSCAKIWGSVSRGKCVWSLNARRSHLDFLCRW